MSEGPDKDIVSQYSINWNFNTAMRMLPVYGSGDNENIGS